MTQTPIEIRRRFYWAISMLLVVGCMANSRFAVAQEGVNLDKFIWQRDKPSGAEIARSRSDLSFNFYDLGNLSRFSLDLVKEDLARISSVTGQTIDRSLTASIVILHDTDVFSRLKNDKRSFQALGMNDDLIEKLSSSVTSDTPKCVRITASDDHANIYLTVILLSEQTDDCLVRGLVDSFGVLASDVNVPTLTDICILYEGRRRGLRNRQNLSQEFQKLREACLTRAGEPNG